MSTTVTTPHTPPAPPLLARLIGAHMHCTPGKRGAADQMTCGHRYPDTADGTLAFRTAHLTEALTAARVSVGSGSARPTLTTRRTAAAGDRETEES